MMACLRVASVSFREARRSPFYWGWALLSLLLVVSLQHITFFDFEGGATAGGLFLSTVSVAGAVIGVTYALGVSRELGRKGWDLLWTRPVHPASVLLGSWLGLVGFQCLLTLVLLAGFLADTAYLGRTVPADLGGAFYLLLVELAALGAFDLLVALAFRGFWSFALLVGGFLLGHLGVQIPRDLEHLRSALHCLVPDLSLSSVGTEAANPWLLAGATGYALSYTALAGLAALLMLKLRK